MEEKQLSFCTLRQIDPRITEVVVFDGVEIDEDMVEEYHRGLLEINRAEEFGLLVDKRSRYTYTFGAQMRLATIPEIAAMAVVVYNKSQRQTTEALADMPRGADWNLEVFAIYAEALQWLRRQLEDRAARRSGRI